jgi:Zn-dependent peptidase ImmA (M78 family)
VVPRRGLSPAEAVAVAELQTAKLLKAAAVTGPPVPESVIVDLPRVRVSRRRGWPTSGLATTVKDGWVIVLRAEEAGVRQRFSLAHEFKHVLDDPSIEWLYPTVRGRSPEDRAEQICDWFAANVLMPRAWVKADWASHGIQDVERLARRYQVSRLAMGYRLDQLGLRMPHPRCGGIRRIGVAA